MDITYLWNQAFSRTKLAFSRYEIQESFVINVSKKLVNIHRPKPDTGRYNGSPFCTHSKSCNQTLEAK